VHTVQFSRPERSDRSPHTHHCGGDVTRPHIGKIKSPASTPSARAKGRNSAPHDAVPNELSYFVVQNEVTDAAVVEHSQLQTETPSMRKLSSLIPPQGRKSFWKCRSSQLGQTLHWGEAHEPEWMWSMRSCERAKKKSTTTALSGGCLDNEAANSTFLTPILMSACGAMGPSMVAFLIPQISTRPS